MSDTTTIPGVQIIDPNAPRPPPPPLTGPQFSFVRIPHERTSAVSAQSSASGEGEVLTSVLAPLFADDGALDESTVMREMRQRVNGMLASGGGATGLTGEPLKAPSAAAIQRQAAGGACEAYPLLPATPDNGYTSVKLYIDEIGALRGRPRNARAEEARDDGGGPRRPLDPRRRVRRPVQPRAQPRLLGGRARARRAVGRRGARRAHARRARAGPRRHRAPRVGRRRQGGVHVEPDGGGRRGARRRRARGRGAAKRVKVGYGRGEALSVSVDGAPLASVAPLFARVTPDECTWTVDGGAIVVTMQRPSRDRGRRSRSAERCVPT